MSCNIVIVQAKQVTAILCDSASFDVSGRLLYGETIGSYPEDKDIVVKVRANFEDKKASFYAD